MESFLTVNEYASLLKISPMTVYRQCKAGTLKHRREGNAIRIYSQQLTLSMTESENNEAIKSYVFGDSSFS